MSFIQLGKQTDQNKQAQLTFEQPLEPVICRESFSSMDYLIKIESIPLQATPGGHRNNVSGHQDSRQRVHFRICLVFVREGPEGLGGVNVVQKWQHCLPWAPGPRFPGDRQLLLMVMSLCLGMSL